MEPRLGEGLTRRRLLAGTGALAVGGFAGCTGGADGGGAGGGGGGYGGGGGGAATTTAGNTLGTHPASADLGAQPVLGPAPADAEAVIVDFSDPSCPTCRRFEEDVVPRIEAELVEPGRAAFVFRGYPVIYEWGKPATQALESTYARDAEAFWALKDFYYAEQRNLGTENVLTETRAFLAAETALDADAVVTDAEEQAHGDAVQADLDAGQAAGAGRTTPHLFLFRDGEFVTKAAGSVSYSVITNALDL